MILLATVTISIYFPINSARGFHFSPHPLQHSLFIAFKMMGILTGVKWYIIVNLICISVIINNVVYSFMCLLAICMFYLEKCLFKLSAHFWLCCLSFWIWNSWAAYIFWRLILCQLFHLQLLFPFWGSSFYLVYFLFVCVLCKTF